MTTHGEIVRKEGENEGVSEPKQSYLLVQASRYTDPFRPGARSGPYLQLPQLLLQGSVSFTKMREIHRNQVPFTIKTGDLVLLFRQPPSILFN